MTKLAVKLQGRIWFEHDGEYILGPGVVRLIRKVRELGSLKKAAEWLNMPYRGAWGRIKKAENALGFPLLEGTSERQLGMKATAEAVELIEAYDILDRQCRAFLAEKSQDFPFLQADVAGEDDWHGQDDVPPETDNTAQPS
jgi:molybdate transport system regulatory protein